MLAVTSGTAVTMTLSDEERELLFEILEERHDRFGDLARAPIIATSSFPCRKKRVLESLLSGLRRTLSLLGLIP